MAKLNIEYDTEDKSLAIVLDGKKVENLAGCSFYPNYDEEEGFSMSYWTREKSEDGITKVTTVMASKDGLETETKDDVNPITKALSAQIFPNRKL